MESSAAAVIGVGVLAGVLCAQPAPSTDGSWRTEGYGSVLTITRDSITEREVTAVSCLPGERFHRVPSADGRLVYGFDGEPETLEIRPGADADQRRLHVDGTASDQILHRIDRLPDRCREVMSNTPQETFDVFWETFEENYPFFALKHVDWQASRDRYRTRAVGARSDALFAILRAMIVPLHDAHTSIDGGDSALRYRGYRGNAAFPDSAFAGRAFRVIAAHYLQAPPRTWCNGHVAFGMLRDSIAYLRVTAFGAYVHGGGYATNQLALDAALDSIFASTSGWRGLVIDVRINRGGDDPLGLAIADRLATTRYVAYAKVARRDPTDPHVMTAPQPSVVQPSTRPGWHGPVIELTGDHTVSAGETFTQALMGRTPGIRRVGEPTQGVFADVLERHLPNGWRFGLPNELFLTRQGTSFDGSGIPPTDPVAVFREADLAAGRDPALERAMALLRVASGSR